MTIGITARANIKIRARKNRRPQRRNAEFLSLTVPKSLSGYYKKIGNINLAAAERLIGIGSNRIDVFPKRRCRARWPGWQDQIVLKTA
jgi:hypothetical protein